MHFRHNAGAHHVATTQFDKNAWLPAVSADFAAKAQQVAWQIAQSYEFSGVGGAARTHQRQPAAFTLNGATFGETVRREPSPARPIILNHGTEKQRYHIIEPLKAE